MWEVAQRLEKTIQGFRGGAILGNDKAQLREWKRMKIEVSEVKGFREWRRGYQ